MAIPCEPEIISPRITSQGKYLDNVNGSVKLSYSLALPSLSIIYPRYYINNSTVNYIICYLNTQVL